MRIQIQIWLLLVTAAAGAILAPARHVALASNLVSPLPSTTEALSSSSNIGISTLKSSDFPGHQKTQDATTNILVNDTKGTSDETTETTQTKAETQFHAEPDASLEIAFLVLGVLLALASVVVAIFFGYKQLSFMRDQSSVRGNNTDGNGNGVDLEMGPVVAPGDASDGVGAASDLADPSSPPPSV